MAFKGLGRLGVVMCALPMAVCANMAVARTSLSSLQADIDRLQQAVDQLNAEDRETDFEYGKVVIQSAYQDPGSDGRLIVNVGGYFAGSDPVFKLAQQEVPIVEVNGGEQDAFSYVLDISGMTAVQGFPPVGTYLLTVEYAEGGGERYYFDSTDVVLSTGSRGLQSTQVFTSSGAWTKPEGIRKVKVFVTGGGGGGGSHNADDAQGGGGAGGTAIKLVDVSTVSVIEVAVGTGGAGSCGNDSSGGSNGGASRFGNYATAYGGTRPATWAVGGLGGDAIDGDINIAGGDGFGGQIDGYGNSETGGNGGASYWGSGGRGGSHWGRRTDARAYGAGGAGAHASTDNCGSNGMSGIVVIEEYR